jgi:phospholipid/cholesterol/gamma-HCH transport system substrate-binding protein
MFKGNRNLVVGIFVSVAIAAFISFVLWLTGRSGNVEMSRYSVVFASDVSGLAIGGPVKYMGVNIGSVLQMEIIRRDGVSIRVDIEILKDTPVDQGTYASLALQGITGVAVINLGSDEGRHDYLAPTPGFEYPVIPVRTVGFGALMEGAPIIMARLDELLINANEILGETNRKAIEQSMQNVEALTTALAENKEVIAALPGTINDTLTDIQGVAGQLKILIAEAQPGINATIDNLNSSAENLSSLTDQLDNWMLENQANLERFVKEGLGEAPELISNARQALRQMDKLMAELQDDPSILIYRPQEDALEIEP